MALAVLLGPEQPIPPILAFLSAVACAAWYSEDWRLSLAALSACALAARYLLLDPVHSFSFARGATTIAECSFVAAGAVVAVAARKLSDLRRVSQAHGSHFEEQARKHDGQILALRQQLQTEINERQRVQEAMSYFQAEY
jgi:phosphoglycerate-specific signal transduction histidine kinase